MPPLMVVLKAIREMSNDELDLVNQESSKRRDANNKAICRTFKAGDLVSFENKDGQLIIGTVLDVKVKNVVVESNGGPVWTVSAPLLSKVGRDDGGETEFPNDFLAGAPAREQAYIPEQAIADQKAKKAIAEQKAKKAGGRIVFDKEEKSYKIEGDGEDEGYEAKDSEEEEELTLARLSERRGKKRIRQRKIIKKADKKKKKEFSGEKLEEGDWQCR